MSCSDRKEGLSSLQWAQQTARLGPVAALRSPVCRR